MLGAIRPWNFLSIEVFVFTQTGSLSFLVLMRVCCFCGILFDINTHFTNSITICALCVFINATICGFAHPKLSFEMQTVRRESTLNGEQLNPDVEDVFDEKAVSPTSMLLMISSVSGLLYTCVVFISLCICKCKGWVKDCRHVPEDPTAELERRGDLISAEI